MVEACASVPSFRPIDPTKLGTAFVLTAEDCRQLWQKKRSVSVWASIMSALSGASGIVTVLPQDQMQRWVPGATSLVVGSIAFGLTTWAKSLDADFEAACTMAPP